MSYSGGTTVPYLVDPERVELLLALLPDVEADIDKLAGVLLSTAPDDIKDRARTQLARCHETASFIRLELDLAGWLPPDGNVW